MEKDLNKEIVLGMVIDNLEAFIENIKCLKETFEYSEEMLHQQVQEDSKSFEDFVKKYKGTIPATEVRLYKELEKKKKRSEKALVLIPPSYIVSLVSAFDTFYAGIYRCVFQVHPNLLKGCEKQYTYKDLEKYETVSEVKSAIIEDIIEDALRENHKKQFELLAKAFGVKSLTEFKEWPDFIELTERRNLFVHTDGLVSSQYISMCKQNNYSVDDIEIGARLGVDKQYFEKSFKLVYKISIMLTQILLNKLYVGNHYINDEDRDRIIINNIFDLIQEQQYELAISLADFALQQQFKHNYKDSVYIILNKAQSYKWLKQDKQCEETLNELDTSALKDDLIIPILVLQGKYKEVYEKMLRLKQGSKILTKENYREWPIFHSIRKEKEFKETFKAIFQENLDEDSSINIQEDKKQEKVEEPVKESISIVKPHVRSLINPRSPLMLNVIAEQVIHYLWENIIDDLDCLGHHYEYIDLTDLKITNRKKENNGYKYFITFNSLVKVFIDNDDCEGFIYQLPTKARVCMKIKGSSWTMDYKKLYLQFDTSKYYM